MNVNETIELNDLALTDDQLTDLEPNGEVKGGETSTIEGHNIGALRNVAGANTYTGQTTVNVGVTLQIQGGLTVAEEGLGL